MEYAFDAYPAPLILALEYFPSSPPPSFLPQHQNINRLDDFYGYVGNRKGGKVDAAGCYRLYDFVETRPCEKIRRLSWQKRASARRDFIDVDGIENSGTSAGNFPVEMLSHLFFQTDYFAMERTRSPNERIFRVSFFFSASHNSQSGRWRENTYWSFRHRNTCVRYWLSVYSISLRILIFERETSQFNIFNCNRLRLEFLARGVIYVSLLYIFLDVL